MNNSIPTHRPTQTTSKFAASLLSLTLVLASGIAVAQSNNVGGVGGTDTRRVSELTNPVTGNGSNPDCSKANSIGVADVKQKGTEKILRRDYACRGQMLESSNSEIIELYLRTGEKIIVLENSAVVVE